MTRAFALTVACVVILCLLGTACSRKADDGSPKIRNVLLITLDTLRPDHLGCYGHPTIRTPHLDRLADRSARFTQAITGVPTTLASHLSILTGTCPRSHGIARNGFRIDDRNLTLAEMLKAEGYTTAAFVSAFSLDEQFNLGQGFDLYNCTYAEGTTYDMVHQAERRAEETTDAALEWLTQHSGGPFFLWIHYFDPHFPYDPPGSYQDLYDPEYRGRADGSMTYMEAVWDRRVFPSATDRSHLIALYDGEISYMDEHIGRFLEEFSRLDLMEQSIVIVVADHGESLGEHEYDFNHGDYVYDASIRVPLMIHDPSLARGKVIDEQVETLDLAPTVLDFLGLPIPEVIEGRSLRGLLHGETGGFETAVFSEASKPWNVESESGEIFRNKSKAKCARTREWKFIHTPYLKTRELYHLSEDPGETRNLIWSRPEVARKMEDQLQAWATKPRSGFPSEDMTPDPETLERLRSIGYLR